MERADLWKAELDVGLTALGLAADDDQRGRLLRYLALLEKWNRAFNLSAVREPRRMVSRHLLDSLSVLALLQGPRILDAGTGAGLPGLPLAIVSPALAFTLVDASAKKTRFVRQAVLELGLANVEIVHSRLERFRPETGFDTVTARALAPLGEIVAATRHLIRPGGRLLAMKGPRAASEVANARLPPETVRILPLRVPEAREERCVVVVTGF